MGSNLSRLIAACFAGLLLAACDDAPSDPTPQASTAPKVSGSSDSGLPPQMVAAVSAGGNSSAISVHFALGSAPTVNTALPVDIAIVPHQVFTAVRAHFDSRDGLALATGNELTTKSDPRPEKAIQHELVLMPARDGVFMVSAIVETEGADGTISRVFSIPVIVAPPAAAEPAAPAPPAPSGG